MIYIRKIKVKNFWETHQVNASFKPDVNFIVGINGSGKTTFINLIASALLGNLKNLKTIAFDDIYIELKEVKSKDLLSISISKTKAEIIYNIKRGKKTLFNKSFEGGSHRIYNKHRASRHSNLEKLYILGYIDADEEKELKNILHEIVKIDWLPVLRAQLLDMDSDEEASDVDTKLKHVKENIENYFISLDTQKDKNLKELQQEALLSLIEVNHANQPLPNAAKIKKIKKQLNDLFTDLEIPEIKATKKINEYFSVLENWHQDLKGEDEKEFSNRISLSLPTVITWPKLQSVIEKYENFINSSERIYLPKTQFFELLESFFQRKKVILTADKKMVVETQSGKMLMLNQLSSGEKQLFILLGECLLQRQENWIYIADEPELSMHVIWQNKLVNALKHINPNAQILFATHSPEIIAEYPDNHIFDMEKHID